MQLTTERCRLQPLITQHADFVCQLLNDPSYLQYIGDRHVRTTKQAATYITDYFNAQKFKDTGYFVVINEIDQPIGMTGLMHRSQTQNPDLGYAFLSDYQNQGYANESTKRLLQEIAQRHAPIDIDATTNTNNIASQKLLQKLGFRRQENQKQSGVIVYKKVVCLTLYM